MDLNNLHDEWYQAEGALLTAYPLSEAACALVKKLVSADIKLDGVRDMRPALKELDEKLVHSFKYKGSWKSFGPEEMKVFYIERARHMVGELRMREWAMTNVVETDDTGIAVCFWYQLDGSRVLEDAIRDGLVSTRVAFRKTVVMTYQDFDNMPEHVHIVSAEQVRCAACVSC